MIQESRHIYGMAIAAGGAAGAVVRYALDACVQQMLGGMFPWGILCVNVLGSCGIGFLYGMTDCAKASDNKLRALLSTGFLGGFTTFSAFVFNTLQLYTTSVAAALLNILLNVGACLLAAWIGHTGAGRVVACMHRLQGKKE